MSRGRILVVDDHADVADAMTALIELLGYDTATAYDGEEALEHVRMAPPNLVLLDHQMPGMSGFDVLREIRLDRRFDSLAIVICSAADSPHARDEALRLGAQDFVRKDVAFEELDRVIPRFVGDGDSRAGASAY